MRNTIFNFDKIPKDKVAVHTAEKDYTYADLTEQSAVVSHKLGVRRLVFCLARNSFPSLVGYLGAINYGHVPLLLSSALDRELLDNLLHSYRPSHIWTPAERRNEWPDWEEEHSLDDYVLLKAPYEEIFSLHPDLALLLPTSGSTGSPKLVRHSYENLRSNIAAIVEYLGTRPEHTSISSLPMHYTYGLSCIHIHLQAGGAVVMTEARILQKEFWDLFKRFQVTTISGVPYTWEMLRKLGIMTRDLPSLARCDQAGGKLAPALQDALIEWAAQTGREFIVMYGQTEASPRMGYLPWPRAKEKHGCMGIPIPGGQFQLLDDSGRLVEDAELVGELIYTGPNVTMGYAIRGEDLALGDEWHGVLYTGDMARRDKDGFYTIVGRKARFIKIFGNRVNLDDTERIIRAHMPGLDCACSGKDDHMVIFVAGEHDAKELKHFISEKTGLNHTAFEIRPIEAIPRNESGKIQYNSLKEVV